MRQIIREIQPEGMEKNRLVIEKLYKRIWYQKIFTVTYLLHRCDAVYLQKCTKNCRLLPDEDLQLDLGDDVVRFSA